MNHRTNLEQGDREIIAAAHQEKLSCQKKLDAEVQKYQDYHEMFMKRRVDEEEERTTAMELRHAEELASILKRQKKELDERRKFAATKVKELKATYEPQRDASIDRAKKEAAKKLAEIDADLLHRQQDPPVKRNREDQKARADRRNANSKEDRRRENRENRERREEESRIYIEKQRLSRIEKERSSYSVSRNERDNRSHSRTSSSKMSIRSRAPRGPRGYREYPRHNSRRENYSSRRSPISSSRLNPKPFNEKRKISNEDPVAEKKVKLNPEEENAHVSATAPKIQTLLGVKQTRSNAHGEAFVYVPAPFNGSGPDTPTKFRVAVDKFNPGLWKRMSPEQIFSLRLEKGMYMPYLDNTLSISTHPDWVIDPRNIEEIAITIEDRKLVISQWHGPTLIVRFIDIAGMNYFMLSLPHGIKQRIFKHDFAWGTEGH